MSRVRVINPPSALPIPHLGEIWQFRDLITSFAVRDLKLRYRQTALGVAWVVLQPLLAAGIFSFVFGAVANLDSDGVPYFAFAYVGMVGWNLFMQTLTRVSGSLVGNAQLVSKVFFPRLVLPISTLGSVLVDLAVALLLGVVIVLTAGVQIPFAVLLLPLWLVLLAAFGLGLGLIFASLMVTYRDVAQILPVATQLLLYATPVAYSASAVPEKYQQLVQLNPLATIVEGIRVCVLGVGRLEPLPVLWAIGASIGVLVWGSIVFTRAERRFADVI